MVDRLLDGRQFREQDPGAVRAVEADHLEVLGDPAATGLGHLDDQPGVGVVVGKDAVDFGVFVKEAGENGLFFLHRGVVINLVGNGGITGLAHQILVGLAAVLVGGHDVLRVIGVDNVLATGV